VWLGKDIQTKLAAEGLSIPMVKGTSDAIQNPFDKALALEVNNSGWISVAMDQAVFARSAAERSETPPTRGPPGTTNLHRFGYR